MQTSTPNTTTGSNATPAARPETKELLQKQKNQLLHERVQTMLQQETKGQDHAPGSSLRPHSRGVLQPSAAVNRPSAASTQSGKEQTQHETAEAPAPAPDSAGPESAQDYERKRQERIAANQARLRELGLGNGFAAVMEPPPAKSAARSTAPAKKREAPDPVQQPMRRSTRARFCLDLLDTYGGQVLYLSIPKFSCRRACFAMVESEKH
jgi:hypothetical protein